MSKEIDIAALRKAAQLEYPHEQMDAMALARYKVGPAGPGVWSSHAVRAGNGSLILWHGRKADCENVARRLTGAFLDGGTALFDLILPALLDRLEQAEKERDELKAGVFPMQPIHVAEDGCIRFKKNRIVDDMLEHSREHGFGLNEMAMRDYTDDERMQLAQLIGYSVSGYGNLSYASEESVARADEAAEAILAAMQGESA